MNKYSAVIVLVLFSVFLFLSSSVHGVNDHGLNPPQEQEARDRDAHNPYVSSGCLHTLPASSLIVAAKACDAYVVSGPAGQEELAFARQVAAAITVPDVTGTHWIGMDESTFANRAGYSRPVFGGHYLLQQSATQPAVIDGVLVVTRLEVAGSVLTEVIPFAFRSPTDAGQSQHSVVNWGALCDGSTDDEVAFELAINATIVRSGGTVTLPEGTCVSSEIAYRGGLRLIGQGMNATVLRLADAADSPLLRPLSETSGVEDGIEIAHMTIDGNSDNNPSFGDIPAYAGLGGSPLRIAGPANMNVHDVIIRDCPQDCILIRNKASHIRVERVSIFNYGRQGFTVTDATDVSYIGGYVSTTGGVAATNSSASVCVDLEPNASDNDLDGMNFAHLILDRCGARGVAVTLNAGATTGTTAGFRFSDILVLNPGVNDPAAGDGIRISDVSDVTLTNITVIGAQNNGIRLGAIDEEARDIALSNCTVRDSQRFGLLLEADDPTSLFLRPAVSNCILTNNNISGLAQSAVFVEGGVKDLRWSNIVSNPNQGIRFVFSTTNTEGGIVNGSGQGVPLASATTITLPTLHNHWLITGTTNIATIDKVAPIGRMISLTFEGILTVEDNTGNLELAGDFVTAAGRTLLLVSENSATLGFRFRELSRSLVTP